jgi:hypothetical protein
MITRKLYIRKRVQLSKRLQVEDAQAIIKKKDKEKTKKKARIK